MEDTNRYWILEYDRYGLPYQYKSESKEGALNYGCYREDACEISMYQLLDPDGNVVMNKKELSHYYIHTWEG